MALSYFQTGFRLMAGQWFNPLINAVNTLIAQAAGTTSGAYTGTFNGTVGATTPSTASVTTFSQNGIVTTTPQILAAAGATQGAAGVITKSTVIVTVTASTEGVKLPTAATGKRVDVFCPGTVGVKVYPFSGDAISGASTNAAVLLVAGKANTYVAKDTATWVVLKGA